MSDAAAQQSRVQEEAARWFAQMSRASITTEALREFRAWKRDAANAAAYAQVEATWDAAASLIEDPEIAAATAEVLRRRPPRPVGAAVRARWPIGLLAAAVAGVGAIALGVALYGQPYSTRVGEQRLVVLSDGSRVRLNTDSAIRVRYRPGARRLQLARGEAFFEVAHDATRPFIVEADGARVRALGTKFDVRREDQGVSVTLLEGKVQVAQDDAPPALLTPNQRLTVRGGRIGPAVPADAGEVVSWTTGRLNFRALALGDAVAEVNRYAPHKLVLDGPPELGQQPVSGVFNAGDTAAFVSAAQALFDLQAATDPRGTIHLSRRATPAG